MDSGSLAALGMASGEVFRMRREDQEVGWQKSECPFLGEAEAGQGYAVARFGDLHLHHGRIGRVDLGGPQHRVLREYFAVYLGDQVILAGGIVAPHLSEFDTLHSH
jgi:hypothetical protein